MNEEFQMFASMQHAYKRIDEISSLNYFVKQQIDMYGEDITAKEILTKLNNEKSCIIENILDFLKNKSI